MPSMLPYVGVYLGCSVGIALIIGRVIRSSDEEQIVEQVKAEHLAEAKQQVEDFLAEATRVQAMTFSRMQAEAYESDVARLAALN